MLDCLQKEIESLAKVRKGQMTERLRKASTDSVYLALIAELLISIEYELNIRKKP